MLKISFLNQFPACPAPYVHGDTTLIRFPDGKTMLIDVGIDMTYYLTLQWLRAHGVTDHIDYFVATHYHADHVGIFHELAEAGYTFGKVLTSGWGRNNCNADPDFFEGLKKAGLEETVLRSGDSFSVSGAKFEVLWPRPDAPETPEMEADAKMLNTYGLMFKTTYGSFSALFTADVLHEGEAGVLAMHREKLPSSFLKEGHHGNDDSNSQDFLDAVRPIVSLAFGRWVYGKNATARIRSLTDKHFIVGEDGNVELVTDGKTFTVSSENFPPKIYKL